MSKTNINNELKISKKDSIEINQAVKEITKLLIVLKVFSDKNKNYNKMTYVDSMVDKISENFEKIACKF